MYDIYKSIKGRKTYIVTNEQNYDVAMKFFKNYFKASEKHIDFTVGWTYNNKLWLDNPEIKGAKTVGVAYYV